jgi:hypothetical protein
MMEIFVDRRTDRCSRMLTDTSVELVHEDFEEPFEADCVDLSTGGASIRASCLPEVGASFICRFEDSPSGESIEVMGRVVWVHLEGERKGEFGVRFVDLDERSEAFIARIICEDGDEAEDAAHSQDHDASMSKLLLDGVSTPIAARISHIRDDMTYFEQELPLLRIERGVFAQQSGQQPRRGAIASVDLRIEGDTPKLVIAVRHQEAEAHKAAVVDEVAPRPAELPPPPLPSIHPETSEPALAPAPAELRAEPGAGQPKTEPQAAREPTPVPIDPPVARERATVSDSSDLFELPEDDEDYQWPPNRVHSLQDFFGAQVRLWVGAFLTLKTGMLSRVGPLWVGLRDQTAPLLKQWTQRLSSKAVWLWRSRIQPLAEASWRRLTSMAWFRRKRRTTALPAVQSTKRRDRTVAFRVRATRLGRMMIFPALVLVGGVLAVYGFGMSTGEERLPVHRPIDIDSTSRSQSAARAEDGDRPSARKKARRARRKRRQSAARKGAASAKAVESATAVGAAVGEPQVAQASHRESAAPTSKGPVFGSRELSGGRTFTLRMSKQVQQLRGIPDKGGFTVIIPGSLSFDRAGPIAASHPLVKRSMILNKGDHAALTIRFVKDARPAYRVTAKGASIEVTIAE